MSEPRKPQKTLSLSLTTMHRWLVAAAHCILLYSSNALGSAVLAAVNEESADFSSFWRTLEGKSAYSHSAPVLIILIE